jgi:hypothetical protein
MTARVVEEADLLPAGWKCEGCGHVFVPGEIVTSLTDEEYGTDPYGMLSLSMGGTESDHDLSSGVISDNWRCSNCALQS